MDSGVEVLEDKPQPITEEHSLKNSSVKPSAKLVVNKQQPVKATSDPLGAVPVLNSDENNYQETITENLNDKNARSESKENKKEGETETKGKSRRVTFPHDGNMVSGSMDPPNPWGDSEYIFAALI